MMHRVLCGSSIILHFVVVSIYSATTPGYVAIYGLFVDHQCQVLSELVNEFTHSLTFTPGEIDSCPFLMQLQFNKS